MSREASSGALSHVYVQYPPLRCDVPGARGLFYDDGSKLLIAPTSNQLLTWKTVPFDPRIESGCDTIGEGPVMCVRYSLDGKVIAVQRSAQEIQFWDRQSGETFNHKCRSESESILGFFWTDCSVCDFVLVKTSGLDLLAYDSSSKSFNWIETKKLTVCWYVYTHESRLVLLASGMQCKSFVGYQLSYAGIVRLPRFEMIMAKPEANSKPVLAAEDIFIVTVYGRIYCLQVDKVAMLLHLYRFYRDAVIQQGSLPIYSTKIAVSVVDNVVLVHQVDAKVVILYDIFADSRAPISAPLPLMFRGLPRLSSAPSPLTGDNSESSSTSHPETMIYGADWTFLVPDLICDISNKLLWKIHLDLEAISASSSEVPLVLEFLQRRKLEASKAKELCLALTRNFILERRPVSMVAKAIDVLVTSYSYSMKTGSHLKGVKMERSSPSADAQVHGSTSGVNTTVTAVDSLGKSSNNDSGAVAENEASKRALTLLTSGSEDNSPSDILKTSTSGLHKVDMKGTPESSSREMQQPNVQPKYLESSTNLSNTSISEQLESQLSSPAISPDEMYGFIFAPVEEEMGGDASYLIDIIVEFLRSAYVEKIKIAPNVYVLTIQLLTRNERYTELSLFIMNKVLEPSKEVAMQLLESGRQNSQIRKLGLDMLRQLSSHHDYVVQLVQDGYYLEALRYARKHKVVTVRPSLFLEAALASNDSQRLAAVLRFFSDFTPGFKQTSDHHTYHQILHEMVSTASTA